MAICKFFENGYCKFGDRCRFEHISPANNQNSRFSFNIKNQNNPTGSTGTASSFSFTKTLQAVAQPAQPAASNFSFGNIQSSNRNNNFSGNSFFQHQPHQAAQPVVAKAASSFSFNQLLKQKVEISDAQMDSDLDFPNGNSTPVKSFFPSQSGGIVSSTPFASGFAFGNASAAPISNSFSQQQRPFFGQPQPNQQTKSSFFGQSQPNQQTKSSFFGQNQPTNQSTKSSFFGQNQSNQPHNPTSFFGATTTATSEPSTKSSPIYSKLNQLSDESRKHYEAKSFSLIPLQPPPYELCF